MPTIEKSNLLAGICPPLDQILAGQLIDEFISQERRFILNDWEPATLDGGQFCEIAARIIYHQDSGGLDRRKSVDGCLLYIEDSSNRNTHNFPQRRSSLHLAKVIRTIYKFRSDRGAVHISPDYSANHLDSKLVIESVRWVISEILRIFWTGDIAAVAAAIRQIVQYDIPVIGSFGDRLLVQRIDCTTEAEILILLHHAGENGLSRRQLGQYIPKDPANITRAIKQLESPSSRKIIKLANNNFRLTAIGVKLVLTDLAEQLLIQ